MMRGFQSGVQFKVGLVQITKRQRDLSGISFVVPSAGHVEGFFEK